MALTPLGSFRSTENGKKMIPSDHPSPLESLGDQAVLVRLPDEASAWALADNLRREPSPWLIDVVQAYRSVAVFYDVLAVADEEVRSWLGARLVEVATGTDRPTPRTFDIPCCYELGLDLERIAGHTRLSREDIIRLHQETVYTVYAIGFCPGFPYLGYLPEPLRNVPRLETPRKRVEAGSVGLTGMQTGIYTEAKPGGWNILGRTPLTLVDVADEYFPLATGDRIRFRAVSPEEFQHFLGTRL